MKVLFLRGLRDDRTCSVTNINPINIDFGNGNIFNHLPKSLNFVTEDIDVSSRPKSGYGLIVNQISDADSHHELLKTIIKKYPYAKFINHPVKILQTGRDDIYNRFNDIDKLIVPKTIKFIPLTPNDIIDTISQDFVYPVIFREAGAHKGEATYLLKSDQDVLELFSVALDGRVFYLTQFQEYVGSDGLYNKTRIVVIDGKMFIRHNIFSNDWMIHTADRNGEFISEEIKKMEDFKNIKYKLKDTIDEIHKRIGLDYFGIDCHIDEDFNILIFEINATMRFFKKNLPAYTHPYRKEILDETINMINRRMK